jgi:hypothetical protein
MQLNNKEIHKLFIESVRYSLTRHSYAPSECADLLLGHWPSDSKCIFCKQIIVGQYDWFGSGKDSGCGHLSCGLD